MLQLGDNGLQATAMQNLALACTPSLVHFNLDSNPLDAEAVKHLISGNWQQLKFLHLNKSLCGPIQRDTCSSGHSMLADANMFAFM